MAKIVHSKAAPSDVAVHYSFAVGDGFDLEGSGSYTTTDAAEIAAAAGHPWLEVKYDKSDVVAGEYHEQISPEDDPLSAVNSVANDPAAVRAFQEDQKADEAAPVAIEASLSQDRTTKKDGVAQTLAADPAPEATTDKGKS